MLRLAALVAATMVAFAANSVFNRMALVDAGTGPASFAAIRVAAGAVTLAVIVFWKGGSHRLLSAMRWRNALALLVYMLGFSFAYLTLDAGLGALVLFGGVQITMFAGALLAAEAIPPRRWAGALIGFSGLVWLLWPVGASAPPLLGAVLMSFAAIGWGIYSLLGRNSDDPLAITAGSFLLALPAVVLVALIAGDPVTGIGIHLAIVSGAITSGLGYALWYALLPKLPVTVAAVAQLTVPVIAAGGGAVFLAESIGWRFAIASALVLGGVLLSLQWSDNK